MLTHERLLQLLSYDPDTGVFRWKVSRQRSPAGTVAGGITDRGYRKIRVEGVKYRANRLAWLYMTGEWPMSEVDHRNGDKTDDRWDNLRDVDRVANQRNQKMHTTNTSGVTGVCWGTRAKKWFAYIGGGADGAQVKLGQFSEFSDAVAARRAAEVLLWGGGHLQQSGINAGR